MFVYTSGEYKSGYRVSCHVSKISRPNIERERGDSRDASFPPSLDTLLIFHPPNPQRQGHRMHSHSLPLSLPSSLSSLFRACSIAAHMLALVVTRIAHSAYAGVRVRPAPTRRQTLTHARIYVYAGIRSRARAMAAAVAAAVVHPGGAEYRRAAMFGPRGEEQQHRRCDDGDR